MAVLLVCFCTLLSCYEPVTSSQGRVYAASISCSSETCCPKGYLIYKGAHFYTLFFFFFTILAFMDVCFLYVTGWNDRKVSSTKKKRAVILLMLLWNAFRRSMNKEYRDVFTTTVILPKLACHPLLRAIEFFIGWNVKLQWELLHFTLYLWKVPLTSAPFNCHNLDLRATFPFEFLWRSCRQLC